MTMKRTDIGLRADETILVFIDIQNDYCHREGTLGRSGHDLSSVDSAVRQCKNAQKLAQAAKIPVVHVRTEHSDWTDSAEWVSRGSGGLALSPGANPIVVAGSWGAEPYEVNEREDELVLIKHRYSGFSYTPLDLVVNARRRSRVLLAGFTTDVCVRATAIDAQALGFIPVLLSDATATTGVSTQEEACGLFAAYHGPTLSVHEMANLIGGSSS